MNPIFAHGTMMGGRQIAGATLFGHGAFALFVFLALAVATAVVIWMVVRHRSAAAATGQSAIEPTVPSASDTALAIARERLARGEIDPEQYTAIISALNG